MLKRLGVKKLPSVVGKLVTGEMHVLRSGIIVKDLKSGIEELRTLLESFEKKNKVSSDHSKKPSQNEEGGNVPFLTTWNIDNVCGEKATVCFIGVFRSSKGRDKLEKIVSEVSRSCYRFVLVSRFLWFVISNWMVQFYSGMIFVFFLLTVVSGW